MNRNETKRIAVITDIHGNLPALKRALMVIEEQNCDSTYVLGDSLAIGPFQRETIDLLLDTGNVKMVLGNHELYYIHGVDPYQSYMQLGEVLHQRWVSQQLGNSLKEQISSLPITVTESFFGITVTFQHYGVTNKVDELYRFAPIVHKPTSSKLDDIFANVDSHIIFYGHDHSPSEFRGKAHYINPGSLGCSKDSYARMSIAEFHSNGTYSIKAIKVAYEKEPLFKELINRDVPERDFISRIFYGQG